MAPVFSSLSQAQARRIEKGLSDAKALGVPALRLVGRWRDRRFSIVDVQPSEWPTATADRDFEDLTLTLPIDADARLIMTECYGFGSKVEWIFRNHKETLDREISHSDGVEHRVDPYCHLALCGQVGPWEDPSDLRSFKAYECPLCRILSKTRRVAAKR